MTDKEKAIIMAHTGICMLTGDKFQIFHKYIEDVMGRPIMTHEIGLLADEIKEKTKADFLALCADESSSENSNKWIPVAERLPEMGSTVLMQNTGGWMFVATYAVTPKRKYWAVLEHDYALDEAIAWMPLPEPYKAESEDKE